ncbi:MAG: DUF4861 domain-containing protein [Muribaculaceae bacterium]|nr:DUF4861 domain-containing protein [Muribaculaceae bacterium]
MIRLSVAALSIASLWSCGPASVSVTVTNPSGFDRNDEIVEVDLAAVSGLLGDSVFVVESPQGTELPVQLTYDGKIIFPATVAAGSSARYTLRPGTPSQSDTVACGAFYPLRKDDFTWENDRAAYRAYGPALQASGERAFGYDVWTKSVSEPVVAERYRLALEENIWFHDDHGNGLDVYTVGPTLGCGTPASVSYTTLTLPTNSRV